MEKREQMYEGKAKKVYATDDPTLCIVSYKDDATAFNGEKRGTIMGKGVINNRLTNRLMRLLMENGIPTHFVEELSERDTLVKRVICGTATPSLMPGRTSTRPSTPIIRPWRRICRTWPSRWMLPSTMR